MLIKKLQHFVRENATKSSINRSTVYYPQLIEQKDNIFTFSCYGTEIEPYQIQIDLSNKNEVYSHCSCKYDYYGICKHSVASFQELINLIKNRQIEVVHRPPSPEDYALYIPNTNGIVNREKLSKISFNNSRGFLGNISIDSIHKKQVNATYEDFHQTHQLVFSFNSSTSELKLSCDCLKTKTCTHKYKFLSLFDEKFGLNYFNPNFEEYIKQELLEGKGLDGVINFEEVFELIIDPLGIHFVEKVKNIIQNPNEIFEFKKAELEELIPKINQSKKSKFGLALCINHDNGVYYDISCIYGKLNKKHTELSAKIQQIDNSNFNEAIESIDNNEISDLKTLTKLEDLSHELQDDEYINEDLANLYNHAEENKDTLVKTRLYTYDINDNFNSKHITKISVSDFYVKPILKITSSKKFLKFKIFVKLGGKKINLVDRASIIIPFGIIHDHTLYFFKNLQQAKALSKFKKTPEFSMLNLGEKQLQEDIIEHYSHIFEIDYKKLKEKSKRNPDLKITKQIYLSEAHEGEFLVFQPIVKYGEQLVSPLSNEKIWLESGKLISQKRNEKLENEMIAQIQKLHPKFKNKTDFFYLETNHAFDSMWIMQAIEQLKKDQIQVLGINNLKKLKYNLNQPSFSIGLSSGTDWFDMNLKVEFGNQQVDLRKLQKSILKKTNYVELDDGSLGILPKKWIEKYKNYFQLGQVKKDNIEISNFQFNIIDELYEELENAPDFLAELHQKKKRIANLKDLEEIKPPKNLKGKLRPYQQDGLNWLTFLHQNKLGGCLADDMGLGKTLQIIAFLLHLKNTSTKKTKPHLVIAPTSLIFNWLSELKKFAPSLKGLSYIGANRNELRTKFDNFDIILTTYGSVLQDIEFHKKQTYNYVILDESQAIKNPQSKRFKAVRLLNCENRLALTGTPIENNTFDLYAQFNFLNPGIFGSIKHFKTHFSEAIDKEQDEESSALLAKIIHPFLLRRTKKQVATELPDKTEATLYCEMGKHQRQVYNQFKDYFKQKIIDQVENEGVNKSQIYILQGLTKLRQICNSTALADHEKDYGNESAKIDELITHLKSKVTNHKILVFSQFVEMLHLVKQRLEKEKITFEYLDGRTKNREEKVANFQNNPKISVFLISLKAGGTGLNLTEADYVYLIDPWWNPAVENQAIDRCYRIGQNKKVMAYRMICKDSIEEKIIELQQKKKQVASEVIRVDQAKKSFNKKDIEHFFGAN